MSENALRHGVAKAAALAKQIEKRRVCVECGRTVILHHNLFNPTRFHDSVFCTCEPYGPPMVRPSVNDSKEDSA